MAKRIIVLWTSRLYSLQLPLTFDSEYFEIKHNRKILIATSVGWLHSNFLVDFSIGLFLRNKGWNVEFVLCRGSLQMCQAMESHRIPTYFQTNKFFKKIICFSCSYSISKLLNKFDFPVYEIQNLTIERADDISKDLKQGLEREALAGYFRNIGKQAEVDTIIYPKYHDAAAAVFYFAESIIKEISPDWIICHHSIYVPQGPIKMAAKDGGVKLLNWDFSERKDTIYVTLGDSTHEFFRKKITIDCLDRIAEKNISAVKKILLKKVRSANDIIKLYNIPSSSRNSQKFDLVFYTNVSWDAGAHGQHRLFSDQMSWLIKSLDALRGEPDIDIAIRIHPGEIRGGVKSSTRTYDELKKLLRSASNVTIFGPADRVDSYKLLKPKGVAIIYASKIGFELAALGYGVISVGNSWAANKSILIEPNTVEEYISYLGRDRLLNLNIDRKSARRALALFWIIHQKYSYKLSFLTDEFAGSIYDLRDEYDCSEILKCYGLRQIYERLLNSLRENR